MKSCKSTSKITTGNAGNRTPASAWWAYSYVLAHKDKSCGISNAFFSLCFAFLVSSSVIDPRYQRLFEMFCKERQSFVRRNWSPKNTSARMALVGSFPGEFWQAPVPPCLPYPVNRRYDKVQSMALMTSRRWTRSKKREKNKCRK